MLLCQVTPPVLVVYASQQGNSKAIAEDLCDECSNHDISASICCISNLGKDSALLLDQACVIFIAATTGDGEPPDTARKFWRNLNKSSACGSEAPPSSKDGPPTRSNEAELKATPIDESLTAKEHSPPVPATQPLLAGDDKVAPVASSKPLPEIHLKKDLPSFVDSSQINCVSSLVSKGKKLNELSYTILGLGDTNYTNFCNFGKNLDEKLHKLGAERFYACGWADDGTGLELVIEPWLEGLWDALPAHLSLIASRRRLREADQQQLVACADDTTVNRGLMEDSNNSTPEEGKDKEVLNNAEVCRIEKMNGDAAVPITTKKGESDINVMEDGNSEVNTSSSQSKKSVAGSTVSSTGLDCGGDKLGLILSTEYLSSAGAIPNESNSTLSKNEKDVLADDVCREVAKLSLKDALKTESFSIDNAWKENHVLLQCDLPSDLKLTISKIPAYGNIVLDYDEDEVCSGIDHLYQNAPFLPSAGSAVYNCDVVQFRKLSEAAPGKEVKKVVEVVAQLPLTCSLDYEPGDSLGLLVRNDVHEVSLVMDLLGLHAPDQAFTLSKAPSAKRALPAHLPSRCTARELFTSCVDYKCLSKKAMLLLLLDSVTDTHEKRCLQELVCREGAELYKKKVLDNRLTFFDVFSAFSSCRPKLASLLEVLPRLIPRPYSLTSSPLNTDRRISFAYSLTVIPATTHVFRERYGVCTGLLDRLSEQMCDAQNGNRELPVSAKAQLSLYLRNSNRFRLPDDPGIPIILVGPGCGVAPLVGFLRHRQLQTASKQLDVKQLGTSWLFFGCRYARVDELYKDELEKFHQSGILTHLRTCFSREPVEDTGAASRAARYVQDAVRAEGEALSAAITEREARVYVCGDAANMAKDVLAVFGEVMAERLGSADQGVQYVARMQKDGRYLQDVWT